MRNCLFLLLVVLIAGEARSQDSTPALTHVSTTKAARHDRSGAVFADTSKRLSPDEEEKEGLSGRKNYPQVRVAAGFHGDGPRSREGRADLERVATCTRAGRKLRRTGRRLPRSAGNGHLSQSLRQRAGCRPRSYLPDRQHTHGRLYEEGKEI